MTMLTEATIIIALFLSIILPLCVFLAGKRNKGRFKRTLAVNVTIFFGILIISSIAAFAGSTTIVQAATETEATTNQGLATGLGYLAAALVTGMSCIGGGIAVASAASAALGAISEDSSILGKSLIFVGLAEGVALYGLIISFMILGKL